MANSDAAGNLKSPDAVRANGLWSLNLMFSIMGRPFLRRLVIRGKVKRLQIIDSISNESVFVGAMDVADHIEGLAFDTYTALLETASMNISSRVVEDGLLNALGNPGNASWCHTVGGGGKRKQWCKNKARKYFRMISHWRESLNSTA